MITFVKFLKAGNDGTNLGAELLADDNKKYPFAITPECFVNLFAGVWKAASGLSHLSTQEGVAPYLAAQASFAVADMKPMISLSSGPLTLLLQLSAQDMAYLQSQMKDFEKKSSGGLSH